MTPMVRWLRRNTDAVLALLVALTVLVLTALDVIGANQVSAAILLVLALLAATLLRDRQVAAKALIESTGVRQIAGTEVAQEHARGHRGTDYWNFRGGTGTYLRAVTLPECVKNARRERRPLRVQIEVIDPTDEPLCTAYARYRSSLSPGPDGTGEVWTPERTRKESFASILAAYWYRKQYTFLTVELGLSRVMTTFRWDQSKQSVIMTQDDPAGTALVFDNGTPYFASYSRELVASFSQARRVHVDTVDAALSDEPTVAEVRALFAALDVELPRAFSDRDVAEIVLKALRPKNPYR